MKPHIHYENGMWRARIDNHPEVSGYTLEDLAQAWWWVINWWK